MRYLPIVFLLVVGLIFAQNSAVSPLEIPKGAVQVDGERLAIPLINQSKKGLLLFDKLSAGKDFCVLKHHQARQLVGQAYKEIEGLKPILVKWKFLEPVDLKGIDLVTSDPPSVYSKEGVLYISSSGIDIGNVGKVAEGILIIQVADDPSKVIFKLHKVGW